MGQPHTLRVEVDHLLSQVTVIFDEAVVYQGSDVELIPLQSPKFYLRSIRSNDVTDVCWHSIKLLKEIHNVFSIYVVDDRLLA